jgi:lipoteichoic acid synthase
MDGIKKYKKAFRDSLAAAMKNSLFLFVAASLIKLVYFNSQIKTQNSIVLYMVISLGALMILGSFGLLMSPSAARRYLLILNIMASVVVFCDTVFYRYFNDLISIPMLLQAKSLGAVKSSMLELLHWSDLIFAADLLFPAVWKPRDKAQSQEVKPAKGKLLKSGACMAIGILIVYGGISNLVKSQPTILQSFYDRVYVTQNIGLFNYHAVDVLSYAAQSLKEKKPLDPQKEQAIKEFFVVKKAPGTQQKQLFGIGKDKNVIMIQVEALQQFVIHSSINGREITPNLNRLAAANLYFDNYFYQTAGGGTSDAEFTALNSMYPLKEGSVYIRKPGNAYYSLPLKLKEEGYSTIAMHGYKAAFWNRGMVYHNMGFDEFFSKESMKETELLGMGISDKAFFEQSFEKLKTLKQPYYAFAITLSSHFPYDNDRSKYDDQSFDVGEYKDTLLGNYLEAVHYTDAAIGEFVGRLKAAGMLENTLLVIYGDHHGIPKDNQEELASFVGQDSLASYEWLKLQKVPLIMRIPGMEGQTVSTAGGGVDFMPTLLNIMGLEDADMPSFGRDLINSQEGLVVWRNGSFATNDKIYISNENLCYDIETGDMIPQEKYQQQKEAAERYLDYSDTLIKYNLVNEIRDYLSK